MINTARFYGGLVGLAYSLLVVCWRFSNKALVVQWLGRGSYMPNIKAFKSKERAQEYCDTENEGVLPDCQKYVVEVVIDD